ncbi:MAG: nicotinate-nucleotide diphosphorylase (carboxylating) [Verrucomicrobia bacterium]|nr:MAG: nicotinate-nucleotide diphosphorylase (carboxylating) [Verrucomicrobiota bacterium]
MKTPLDPIDIALREDIGAGDLTSEFFVAPNLRAHARIVANEAAVIAGAETAAEVFRRVDPATQVRIVAGDGTAVNPRDNVIELDGTARALLTVDAASDHARIIDTRKTTPGLRALEKAAVLAGGGANHRFGLFDMVLVKDNHLAACAGWRDFANAIRRARGERPGVQIEVEADNLEQVRELLQIDGIDVILLDNMKPAQIREAVALGKGKTKFEASGGVTLKNIRQIAATGVDFISIGALTHSARAIDLSLEFTHVGA